ncbi:MAG: cytidylate kinase-like family protein [Acidobacteria bacterium]|nr:cytidylate kinase-like family protein [Acidobacteriota bacterium]MCI0718544.1 cytidylate kinase-like family protein [Acidobacteriota bacterium]
MINLITISRERGSGGRSVGTRLAQELGMECFGKEIVYDIAQSAGVAKESVEKYDQEHYNKWNLIIDSLRISSHFSPDYGFNFNLANIEPEIFFTEDKYLQTTQEILTKLGNRPGVILLGRGSQVIFKDRKDALHIRLVAPLPVRISRISEMLSIPEKEAARNVAELDKSRASYLRNFYSVDVNDAQFYHLTINTGQFDYGQTCEIIKHAMKFF